jgi:hypothetical protein
MGMWNGTMKGAGDRVRSADRIMRDMINPLMGRATRSMPRDAGW